MMLHVTSVWKPDKIAALPVNMITTYHQAYSWSQGSSLNISMLSSLLYIRTSIMHGIHGCV